MPYEVGDATEVFLSSGLSKVLKLNNICDKNHISDCGMPDKIVNLVGSKVDMSGSSITRLTGLHDAFSYMACATFVVDGNSAAFETQNGESVMAWYNPLCVDLNSALKLTSGSVATTSVMCLNLVYDLNGKKGPNTVGKDVGFMTAFYPSDSILVAPMPVASDAGTGVSIQNASKACTAKGDDLRLPNKEEMMSIGLNSLFVDSSFPAEDVYYLTSSYNGASSIFILLKDYHGTLLQSYGKTITGAVRCIKRF